MGAPASSEQQVKARVIFQQREWMTGAGRGVEMCLEADLPEFIGLGMLKRSQGVAAAVAA